MIYKTINKEEFAKAFADHGRTDFSPAALEALYEYYSDVYEGDKYELDVIAICCDWAEYKYLELFEEFGNLSSCEGDNEAVFNELQNCTTVLDIAGESLLVFNF